MTVYTDVFLDHPQKVNNPIPNAALYHSQGAETILDLTGTPEARLVLHLFCGRENHLKIAFDKHENKDPVILMPMLFFYKHL